MRRRDSKRSKEALKEKKESPPETVETGGTEWRGHRDSGALQLTHRAHCQRHSQLRSQAEDRLWRQTGESAGAHWSRDWHRRQFRAKEREDKKNKDTEVTVGQGQWPTASK